jgi:hypothetical protein
MSTTTYQPALALSPEERAELDNAMLAISARFGDLNALRARLGPTSRTFSRAFSSALERVSKPSRSCLDRVRGTIDRLSGGRRSQWADAPDERSSGFETSS